MNLKPNELAALAAGTLPPGVTMNAADELAKLLPNVGGAAATIRESYEVRQHGCYEPDYASYERCRSALQKLHTRVAALLTARESAADLPAVDQRFTDPTSIKDLIGAPLARNEVTTRIERLCKIYDDPKRKPEHPGVKVYAQQLASDVARLGALPLPEATERIQEVLAGATPAILFQPVKIAPPAASPNQPLFSTVTGRDFGRSIAWARKTPNAISSAIRAAVARVTPRDPSRPDPAELEVERVKAKAQDNAEAAADELRRVNGARMRESDGTRTQPPRSGSLSAQLSRAPASSHPLTIAGGRTAAANPALRTSGF